jgi:hypothetical protein
MIQDHEDSPGPRITSETTITGNKSILGDELCTAMHVDMPVTCSQHIATFCARVRYFFLIMENIRLQPSSKKKKHQSKLITVAHT